MDKEVDLEQKVINFLQQLKLKESSSETTFSKQKDSKFVALLKIKKTYDQISQEIYEYQLLGQEEIDLESKKILAQEVAELKIKRSKLIEEFKQELISQKEIKQSAIVEIRPGPGGDEAGLFVDELYCMYANFAEKKG